MFAPRERPEADIRREARILVTYFEQNRPLYRASDKAVREVSGAID